MRNTSTICLPRASTPRRHRQSGTYGTGSHPPPNGGQKERGTCDLAFFRGLVSGTADFFIRRFMVDILRLMAFGEPLSFHGPVIGCARPGDRPRGVQRRGRGAACAPPWAPPQASESTMRGNRHLCVSKVRVIKTQFGLV